MLLKVLFLFNLFPFCIAFDTLTANESLTSSNILLSKERNFALGFFSRGSSRYKYLGIWYHQLPEQTVVWVANRENPINDSSAALSISSDGNLILYASHDQKFPLWSTDVSLKGRYACIARLLDSGNLVLVQSETIVWQSFDYPTDTLLPGMKLGLDRKIGLNRFLTSWKSADDPGIGDTSFKLNPIGSPQLFLYKGLIPYWRSNPWPWTSPVPIPIPKYLYKYTFANTEDGIYYIYMVDDKSVITRSVVDNSGLIQRLTWDNTSRQWKPTWSAPKYRYGHCGANSICSATNVETFECKCLPGYKPKSLTEWYLRDGSHGCVRIHKQTSMCGNGEGFVKVAGLKFPDTSIASLKNMNMTSFECEQLCLRNCSCKAFAMLDFERKGFGCMMWYGELRDVEDYTWGRDLYVRVDRIALGSNLLLSRKEIFALGFFSPGNSKYKYLGIWYHKLPEQTVVWVANRNNPINDTSGVLFLAPDGNLELYNNHDRGLPFWSTNVSMEGTVDCVACLLDSGNLVLVPNDESKRIFWQSFDYPTDTMLPGMKLGLDRRIGLERSLTSWRSADDPGTGDWLYRLNPSGCPQFFLYNGLIPYWRSPPWPWGPTPVPGYSSTSTNNQDEIYYSFHSEVDESIPTRNVVNNSGLVQRLTWDNSSYQWRVSRSDPKYIYGHCGGYSILNANNFDSLDCMCLPGYEPKSIKNWYLRDGSAGCVRKREQTMSMCRNGEGFVKVEHLKVPDTSIAALMNTSLSSTECEQLCLNNCSCKAFAVLDIERKGVGCLTWYGQLMDTTQYSEARELYVRVDAIELGIIFLPCR